MSKKFIISMGRHTIIRMILLGVFFTLELAIGGDRLKDNCLSGKA